MDRHVLTDAQWAKMEPHCLGKPTDPGRSGGDNRGFVEAVLWIARTGSPWRRTSRTCASRVGLSELAHRAPSLEGGAGAGEHIGRLVAAYNAWREHYNTCPVCNRADWCRADEARLCHSGREKYRGWARVSFTTAPNHGSRLDSDTSERVR